MSSSSTSFRHPLVPRTRMQQGLANWRQHRLILMTAPAGYGKSTTAALWMQTLCSDESDADGVASFAQGAQGAQKANKNACTHTAWVALDGTITTVDHLLECIGNAIAPFAPRAKEAIRLGTAGAFSVPQVQSALCAAIAGLDQLVVLLIDDVHLINFDAGLALLQYCIDHAPQNLHLVLLSRTRPWLHFSHLQLANEVLQISAQDQGLRPR
ncbi:MAG: hypothetical protein NTZ50_06955 [Chloroflexi bacterium]|nr:hypothetical protein [Chloroflexota bacterium]